MREILFRGKRRDNREWVFGCYYKQTEFYGDKLEPFGIMIITSSESLCYDQALEYYAISEKTVGQFTGLYDSTKWEDLTDAEKLDFYKQHYIGEDGMSVRFQHIDDVKHLWKGKKIFEGDILSVLVNEMAYPEEGSFEEDVLGRRKMPTGNKVRTVWSVEYRTRNSTGNTFYVFGKDRRFSHILTGNTVYNANAKVIGNIHDNPELLETA